jgi:hypothetical protein
MFAVVREKAIGALAHSRSRPRNHLFAIEAQAAAVSNPDRLAGCKASERHFFDGSPAKAVSKARVVHYVPLPDIDSVVQIATAGCDEVRAKWRLFVRAQKPVVSVKPTARRTFSPKHGRRLESHNACFPG